MTTPQSWVLIRIDYLLILLLSRSLALMALPGLQGYQGDSEISDSEGDVSPEHESAPVPDSGMSKSLIKRSHTIDMCISVISNIGLGIPRSQPPVRPSPPPFTKPVVRSAPSITLVNYDRDEDDDMDMSMEQEVCH